MILRENYSNELIELPFTKIFFKLAIPNLYSTLIAAVTVIFDLWYIGQIGVSELAGVAYIFPIYMLTSMLSNGAFGGAISGACLLYTSPSPRDRQKSRMPSSA